MSEKLQKYLLNCRLVVKTKIANNKILKFLLAEDEDPVGANITYTCSNPDDNEDYLLQVLQVEISPTS
jgi:hypothetical protein